MAGKLAIAAMKSMKVMKAMKVVKASLGMKVMKGKVWGKAMKKSKDDEAMKGSSEAKSVLKGSLKKKPATVNLKDALKAAGKEMTTAEKIKMLQSKMGHGKDEELDRKITLFKDGKKDESIFGKDDMHKLWARLKTARDQDMCFIEQKICLLIVFLFLDPM
jgi:methylthioribose-1-phosphate isomerase